jgi:hypothetical protein
LLALVAGLADAQASVGFTCRAEDEVVKLVLSGAYGTSLGSGMGNFGADIEVRHSDAPAIARRLHLAYEHVGQHWLRHRDLKLMARWQSPAGAANVEVLLIIETQRSEEEGAPYVGRYELIIYGAPINGGPDWMPLELRGPIACSLD